MFSKRLLFTLLLAAIAVSSVSETVMAQDAPVADEHYREGMRLYDEGLFNEAIQQLNAFNRQYSGDRLEESADFYIAKSRAHLDSLNTALYFEKFILKHPNSGRSETLLIELGQRLQKQGRYVESIEYYQRALAHGLGDKKGARVTYWMAEAAASNNSNDEARQYYLQLADNYPESDWAPKALYARGRLYLSENNYDASTEAFELLRKRYPNDPVTRRIGTALGESYYQQKQYQKAIDALKNAMSYLDEEMKSKAVYLIAESYNYLDDYDNASRYYLQYINMNKDKGDVRIAHYGLGWVYYKQGIYHWAADSFAKASEGDDNLARKALYYEAVNEKLGGRYEKALNKFREFGKRFKEGTWVEHAYYEWAITAYEMGIYDESVEVLLRLVRGDDTQLENPGKVYTLLGEAYFANGEYTRALQAYDAAENLTDIPADVKRQARFQKAWVQFRNQAFKQAQPIFENVYTQQPSGKLASEALFWSADSYYNLKDYGKAANQFELFINKFPDSDMLGAARYSLGWSYFQMGEYDKAVKPLEAFLNHYDPPSISLFPYDTDTELRVGDAYYALGKYDEAMSYYQKAIGAEPGGDYAMFQIANCYYRSERSYEAVTTFRKMIRIYPYSRLVQQAQYNVGYVYFLTGNYTQAIDEFKTLINKYPNTDWAARSQYNIGDAYYNAGEYQKSIASYKKVLEEYPKSDYLIEAVNGIQYAQLAAGEKDTSSEILEQFLADHPQATTADRLRFRQAENLQQSGNYQDAIASFRQYIRVTNNESNVPEAYYNIADSYMQLDQPAKARQAYQTIVDNYPASERVAPALAALGRLSFEEGNYQESYGYYNRLLDQSGQLKLEAHIGMGNASLAMNKLDEARQQFETATQLNSSSDLGRLGLGKVALKQKQYDQAESLLQPIAKNNTTEIGAEAQFRLGQSYQQQGDYDRALKAYSNVKVLYEAFDRWVSDALLHSAQCYIEQGNKNEARNTLNAIIDQYPGTDAAKAAQKMLNTDG